MKPVTDTECFAVVCVGLDRPCRVSSVGKIHYNPEQYEGQEVVGGKAKQTLDLNQELQFSVCCCGAFNLSSYLTLQY